MSENSIHEEHIANLTDMIHHYQSVEMSLRESRDIYTTILQRSFAAIYVVQDGKFCNVNIKAAANSGYSTEELIGMNADSLVHPEDKPDVLCRARAMLRGDSTTAPYAFRILTKHGDIRWIMETVSVITYEGRPAILGNSIDITEHRLAIERLRDSEILYRTIFETTLAATIIIEEDTTISLVNSEFSKMSGYSREEWEGKKSWTEFVIPEDRERMRIYHHLRRVNCNAAPHNYEFGFIDNHGRIRNVILMVDMIPQTSKSVASFADITEHKLAVSRLQESENLYRTIFENTGTATMIVEEDMTISLANTEFETLSGAPKEYWENKRKWTELFSQKDLQKMIHYHQQRRIDPETSSQNYQCALIDKQGNKKVVLLAVAMIPGSKKSVISLTDITEQKRVEMALQKREQEVQKKSRNLEEMNSALKVLLKQRETDKLELEENVLTNVKDLILPYLVKLKASHLNLRDAAFVNILEANLMNITSPFFHSLSSNYINLTPKEIQVANLIKDGKTTKEIADIIGVCQGAISLHRDHIRKKMGLNNKKINLNTYLTSLA